MVDESANDNFDSPNDEVNSVPDVITDLVGESVFTGIPAPVRRNFFKALGQLSSAAIDIPVAYLTGMADERRAETAARIKLMNTSAAQIAEQMQTNPEYARVAVQKFGQRVLREQVNLDMISSRALSELRDAGESNDQSGPEESGDTINDDWLNAFETEARLKSTEEMQAFFGKILAGEIKKPGSFSTRTIKILGSLDQNVASSFATLCSSSISILGRNTTVPSLGGKPGKNALEKYGLNFDTLNLLNEHGLVISDYNSWREIVPFMAHPSTEQLAICIPLTYQGRHWSLIPKSTSGIGMKLRIEGVALTRCGGELSNIVKVEPKDEYTQALAQWLEKKGFRMVEVDDGNPRVVRVSDVMGIEP